MGKIGRIIGTVATGGLLAAAPDIINEVTPTPKVPEPIKPLEMPEIDGDAIRKTRQRAMINQQQRGGRTSTMLSDSYDKLG